MTRWMTLGALLAACTPDVLDNSADDYLTMRDGPGALVDADGVYNGGWFSSFEGTVNPDDAAGDDAAWKGWIHLNLSSDRYFVSANLADLNNAANTALVIVDRQTGEIQSTSINDTFGDRDITAAADFSEITNNANGSVARMINGTDGVAYDFIAGALRLTGTATALFDRPMVQTSRYHDGYGSLQWWGNVEADDGATLTLEDGTEIDLSGARGTYDRTMGHRRTRQNWNWLSVIGDATRASDGATVPISLLMARDRDQARPIVDVKKYNVWVDGALHRVPDLVFSYEYTDEETRETGDWEIYTPDDSGDGVTLTFSPQHRRRDTLSYLWFYETDFMQLYGEISGEIRIDGETYTVDRLFALTEDSLLIL